MLMLYDFGAEAVQFTTAKDGSVKLEFAWKVDAEEGKKRWMAFRVRPPMMLKTDGTEHPAATMRLLYWWLKSKLEAVKYGLTDMVEEFLPNVVAQLPEGESITVGDLFIPQIKTGKALDPGGLAKELPPMEDAE